MRFRFVHQDSVLLKNNVTQNKGKKVTENATMRDSFLRMGEVGDEGGTQWV